MESETKLMLHIKDFPNLCRTCLTKGDLVPLKEDYLINFLKSITSIDLEEEDEDLPKSVCASCVNKLEDIKSFIDLCKCNDSNLKEVLKNKPTFQYNEPIPDCESSQENCDDIKTEIEECDLKQESNQLSNIGSRLQKSTRRLYSCKRCQATFRSLRDIQKHHLNKNRCASRKDSECLNYGSDEENGKGNKTKMILYKCEICDKSFLTKSRLKNHLRTHTNDEPYECKTCGKKFKFAQNRRRHENIVHRGIKPYKCDICGKACTTLQSQKLNSSVKCAVIHDQCSILTKNHKVRDQKCVQLDKKCATLKKMCQVKCETCGKSFTSKANYRTHLLVHGDKNHLCVMCGKSFYRKQQLEEHFRIHTGLKPHTCKECGKSFRLYNYYKVHLLTHSGEKPYECELCGNKFAQKSHLKRHLDVHSGLKPHTCEICGKSFANKTNLKVHCRIHTGEMTHNCEVCGKGFYDKSNLKRHMKVHTVIL